MERFTKKINDTYFVDKNYINSNDNGYYGDAINKLSEFENIIDELLLKQNEISKELESLRNQNLTKSVKFRELLGQKLLNSRLLTIFELDNLIK